MEQHRLAKYAGCSVETIRKIEKGRIKLSDQLAYSIALATGVSLDWLSANDLSAPPKNKFGRPYTRQHFEEAQAETHVEISYTLATHIQLIYSARMQAIAEQAWQKGWKDYQLAMFRLDVAIAELEEKIGYDAATYDVESPNITRAVELAKANVQTMEVMLAPPVLGPPPLSTSTQIEMLDGSIIENYDFDPLTNLPRKRRVIRPPHS